MTTPPEIPTPRSIWRRAWDVIEEPKAVTLVQTLMVYAVTITGGALTLAWPPRTTSVVLGDLLVTVIAVLMIAGGIIGAAAAISGWWWVERPLGVGLLLVALSLYGYSVIEAQVLSDGHRWLQLSWILVAAGGLIIRWLRIRRANYDPVA
jgi:hypothetical protein